MAYKNRKHNYPLYETTRLENARSAVENVAARVPDRHALIYRHKPSDPEPSFYTYRQSEEYIRDLATALHTNGYCRRPVALIGEDSCEWIFTYFATLCAGCVLVPVDKELQQDDMLSILKTAEVEAIFYAPSVEKKIAAIAPSVGTLKQLITFGETAPEGGTTIAAMRAEGGRQFAEGNNIYFDYPIDIDACAMIVFTSGTTGKGKGVMLSQRNICSDMEQGMYNFQITYRSMVILPLHHTFGSTVDLMGHFTQGAELYVSSGIRYVTNEMKEFKPEHLLLVPLFVETFYKRIIASAEKSGKKEALDKLIALSNGLRKVGIDLRRTLFKSILDNFGGELHMIICGGAALNQTIIDFFESIGVVILNGYGITECAPLISCNRNECRRNGSVGLPIVGGELKIADPDENGEGEICYRGSNVMLGYFKDEEATKAAIDGDGFFHTGDYGRVDMDGSDQWLTITGRLKNLIILSNGKNVYPEEIETAIQGVPGVGEVVVYQGLSKKDPDKELIVAEIYPDTETLERHGVTDPQKYFDDEIKKINAVSTPYKAVNLVKLRDTEFPKNTSRKITRFKLDKTVD